MAQTRARGKTFPTPLVFPRPLEERAGSPAQQTGGYFAARAFSREMLLFTDSLIAICQPTKAPN
jgi:hypothetical protein